MKQRCFSGLFNKFQLCFSLAHVIVVTHEGRSQYNEIILLQYILVQIPLATHRGTSVAFVMRTEFLRMMSACSLTGSIQILTDISEACMPSSSLTNTVL